VATLSVEGADLVVHMSPLERLGAFRGDFAVPVREVRSVEVAENGWGSLRGIRAPGTGIPGVIAYGTRRYQGGRDFALVLGKRRALVVDLAEGSPFRRLVVTVDDPDQAAQQIRSATGLA
jgi:hypothetical protein